MNTSQKLLRLISENSDNPHASLGLKLLSISLLLGVGKSCLLLQFTDKRFQPVHDLTIGNISNNAFVENTFLKCVNCKAL